MRPLVASSLWRVPIRAYAHCGSPTSYPLLSFTEVSLCHPSIVRTSQVPVGRVGDRDTSASAVQRVASIARFALLIAFNAANINLDERRRENATVFAFWMPIETAVHMTTIKGGVVGITGTSSLSRSCTGWSRS